jgi:DNA-binding HxlR family transcriptional regulator
MTRTVLQESPLGPCPAMDRTTLARYRAAMKASNELALAFRDFLGGRTEAEVSAWIRTSLASSRHLFQPWTMEIVYLAAVFGSTRFSQLEQALGVSSRTLSRKLKELVEAGFLDRTIHDETPVRIEYTLTKDGRRAAALAAPLFTFLNQCARGME